MSPAGDPQMDRLAAAISGTLEHVHVFAAKGSYWWLCAVCPPRHRGQRDRRSGRLPTIGTALDGALSHESTATHRRSLKPQPTEQERSEGSTL